MVYHWGPHRGHQYPITRVPTHPVLHLTWLLASGAAPSQGSHVFTRLLLVTTTRADKRSFCLRINKPRKPSKTVFSGFIIRQNSHFGP